MKYYGRVAKRGIRVLGCLGIVSSWVYDVHQNPSTSWFSVPVTAKCDFKRDDGKFAKAIAEARKCAGHIQIQSGAPGIVAAVSVDGNLVWAEGFGYADVENRVRCNSETVMRIASISKSMTAALLATLMEDGSVDVDADIRDYIDFPSKTWNGNEVKITTRMLASHLGGIRHYEKAESTDARRRIADEKANEKGKGDVRENTEEGERLAGDVNKTVVDAKPKSQFDNAEYYVKDHFDTVIDGLVLFKDDPLATEPGKKFLYSTHGWALVSAVVEAAARRRKIETKLEETKRKTEEPEATKVDAENETSEKSPIAGTEKSVEKNDEKKNESSITFVKLMTAFFKRLDLRDTYFEENDPLIPNRARYYRRNKYHKLENVPYVDNSYKWAGGGFLSTITDLIKFGNAHLYAFQNGKPIGVAIDDEGPRNDSESSSTRAISAPSSSHLRPGFVSRRTMETLWTPVAHSACPWAKEDFGNGYGVGWGVVPSTDAIGGLNLEEDRRGAPMKPTYVSHTGGAVGASSVLLIVPRAREGEGRTGDPYRGVVVAMFANLQEVGLYKTAVKIADLFLDEY